MYLNYFKVILKSLLFDFSILTPLTYSSIQGVPPTFDQPIDNVVVPKGSKAVFTCKISAQPEPTIVWLILLYCLDLIY